VAQGCGLKFYECAGCGSNLQLGSRRNADWRPKQPDLTGRPEAIRRPIEIGLKAKEK
jgi:hypothetical protein